MRYLISLFFRLWVNLSAALYGGEGINIPLMFMPAQLVAPTLSRRGAHIGQRVRLRTPLVIHNSNVLSSRFYKNLSIGNNCYFGREFLLDLKDKIIIEDNVTISHRAMILTHTDAGTSPHKDNILETSQAPVRIAKGAYIGAHVVILQGVEIGENAIVGAGSLVTKSILPGAVAMGVPAKTVKFTELDE